MIIRSRLLQMFYFRFRRAAITPEEALDVLVAADMLALPRLVQLAELAMQPVRTRIGTRRTQTNIRPHAILSINTLRST